MRHFERFSAWLVRRHTDAMRRACPGADDAYLHRQVECGASIRDSARQWANLLVARLSLKDEELARGDSQIAKMCAEHDKQLESLKAEHAQTIRNERRQLIVTLHQLSQAEAALREYDSL